MTENIILLAVLTILLLTTKRRNYMAVAVVGYYSIYIIVDATFFGIDSSSYSISIDYIQYDIICLMLCATVSMVFTYFFYKGSALAGLYSLWLIYNATLCFIGTISGYNEFYFNMLYTVTQNLNLLVDLSVVILGTDNYLQRTKSIGRIINSANGIITSILPLVSNNRMAEK